MNKDQIFTIIEKDAKDIVNYINTKDFQEVLDVIAKPSYLWGKDLRNQWFSDVHSIAIKYSDGKEVIYTYGSYPPCSTISDPQIEPLRSTDKKYIADQIRKQIYKRLKNNETK
jgi:hypothetical protein